MHSSAAGGLLIGGYLSTAGPSLFHVNTHLVFLLSMTARLAVVNCAGSRLLQSGRRLQEGLAALRWPARPTATARLQLRQMMEWSRQPPELDVWGLCTVQKSTVLSLFSFVLTYYVIMLQFKVG
ncbi:hypothetical protein FJT64_003305 [Amphibalanus amphitrite]|uniref:Uncharacterized protein n=1 Tax=Amphibalanus amphitrite TaxID=1232801 RepID=A0A6A4W9I8_AMPAM|nr:hypothetical protein FJT64_003305 [Amphibalanus amphitrite]